MSRTARPEDLVRPASPSGPKTTEPIGRPFDRHNPRTTWITDMRPVRCRLSRVIFGRSSKRPATGSKSRRGARQGQQERSTTLNARIDRSTAVVASPRTPLRLLAGTILTIFVAAFVLTPAGTRGSRGAPDVSVIVRTLSGAQARIEGFVTAEGGSITAELPIIDGFSATLSQRVADAINKVSPSCSPMTPRPSASGRCG